MQKLIKLIVTSLLILGFLQPVYAGKISENIINSEKNKAKESALSRDKVKTFASAKRHLVKIYKENDLPTIYCGCDFDGKVPDLKSCNVTPRTDAKRMNRIEWEHVLPASTMFGHFACWKTGGRKACEKDKVAKLGMADLHNLFPALGEINGNRSNYPFVENIAGEVRKYGDCDIEVQDKTVEPPDSAKGRIARAYLYMSFVYDVPLDKETIEMMKRWNAEYPVSDWEKKRNEIISNIQGNENPWITFYPWSE